MGNILSLDEAMRVAGGGSFTEADDDLLNLMIDAVDEAVESIIGPVLPTTRTVIGKVTASGAVILPYPLTSVTSVTADGVPVDPAGLTPRGAAAGLLQLTPAAAGSWSIGQAVTVTGAAGRATVPATVKLAARELLSHWWQLAQSNGKSAWVGEGGGGFSPSSFGIPNRVRDLLVATPGLPGFA